MCITEKEKNDIYPQKKKDRKDCLQKYLIQELRLIIMLKVKVVQSNEEKIQGTKREITFMKNIIYYEIMNKIFFLLVSFISLIYFIILWNICK